ncbi:uncharacterized protein LOC129354812 [Poeciliopsis prolifica]|uniref:uncharacterized protein LOC129354812 n=1 Tax=Poeciliopsis prolifica TaxID=188132 RepID=UPI002414287D|nr:uncharacterized protein LOC129354812 [Poeciliopsis prolifica]
MDLLGTVLLLVLVGSRAQNLVDVTGEPGQDVTLTCSVNHAELYWSMEDQNQTRTGIGRTASSVPTYFSPDLEAKYSLSGVGLTVRNLSVDDGRMYFCEKREDGGPVYGDPIRLMVSDVLLSNGSSVQLDVPIMSAYVNENLAYWKRLSLILSLVSALLGCCGYCCRKKEDEAADQQMENERMNPSDDCEL